MAMVPSGSEERAPLKVIATFTEPVRSGPALATGGCIAAEAGSANRSARIAEQYSTFAPVCLSIRDTSPRCFERGLRHAPKQHRGGCDPRNCPHYPVLPTTHQRPFAARSLLVGSDDRADSQSDKSPMTSSGHYFSGGLTRLLSAERNGEHRALRRYRVGPT